MSTQSASNNASTETQESSYKQNAGYFCVFCGDEGYRGHRDVKCGNPECDRFEESVFEVSSPWDH